MQPVNGSGNDAASATHSSQGVWPCTMLSVSYNPKVRTRKEAKLPCEITLRFKKSFDVAASLTYTISY
jgi:hypothetical protein